MFYEHVKNQWLQGKVSVELSADADNKTVYLVASGWTQLALMFLSASERAKLAELSKADAKKVRSSQEATENSIVPSQNDDVLEASETERVDITLCIGLMGVCVIGLVGDESEGVFSHIDEVGTEAWFEQLPEHDKPVEGIYTITCDVSYGERAIGYAILSSSCKEFA